MSCDRIHTTRREFVTGGLRLLSASATLPLFLGHTASALAATKAQRAKDDAQRILVVVQLAGGNDGLNTVVPHGHREYYRARPRLAIPERDVLRIDDEIGLHPAATGLKELHDQGRMSIVQGVGYPNPNRSHFVSTDIWMSADPRGRSSSGWLGRYFDNCCHGTADEPRSRKRRKADPQRAPLPASRAIALTAESPLALQGEDFAPLSFNNPDQLRWRAPRGDRQAERIGRALNDPAAFERLAGHSASSDPTDPNHAPQIAGLPDEPQLAEFLRRAALDAHLGADEIRSAAQGMGRGRSGSQLARSLDLVARMIQRDFPTHVYYVSHGGFDTHAGQANTHANLIRQLSDALKGFVDTLERDGLLDRVMVMTFSEFGRRVDENASVGTDHGEAAPLFVLGSQLKDPVVGRHPSLKNLNRGDLAFEIDFRRVYASMLQDWLGIRARDVLGGNYRPLSMIET